MKKPKALHSAGDIVAGFKILGVRPLPEMRGIAYLAEHSLLGTRFLHVHTDDEENLCSIIVPTPPADDTGLPHIMEHSVLAGSRAFPLKDPFFEMLKTSLATFINAMTASDFTVYPFSSVIRKDLFNLAEVYFDSVFHPLLTPTTFRREAYHLKPLRRDDPASPLTVNGIVFNEMRSAYSSPENLLWREFSKGIFSDSLLRFDSGGWPDNIPDLTYESFRKFHENRYHPSNVLLFAYGNVTTADLCGFFSEKFKGFERKPSAWEYPVQPRWDKPRRGLASYPVGTNEAVKERTYLTLTWIADSGLSPSDMTAWRILFQALAGHDGAPLKKALIDSKLGTDVSMNFVYPVGPELLFNVGIKGSEPERADAFQDLVLSTLERIGREGLTPEQVRTAVRQLSYQHLERTQYFTIEMMMSLAPVWMRTNDPFPLLDLKNLIDTVGKRAMKDRNFFKSMLGSRILANPHRLLQVLTPDSALESAITSRRAAALAEKADALGKEGLERIGREADEVDELNRTIDPPEKLALLPRLKTSDLPEKPWEIPSEADTADSRITFIDNDMFTNGICYFTIDFDLSGLPADLYPMLPLFREAFDKMGADGWSYLETSARRASASKFITCWTSFTADVRTPGLQAPHLRCSFTATEESASEALEVLEKLLHSLDPTDGERLQTISRQYLAKCRDRLLEGGQTICRIQAARPFSAAAWQEYVMNGVPSFERAKSFENRFAAEKGPVVAGINAIREFAVSSPRWTVSYTGSAGVAGKVRKFAGKLSKSFPRRPDVPGLEPLPSLPSRQAVFEGLSLPIQNAHSMIVMSAFHASHPDEAILRLGTEVMSSDYWLTQVRLKGNAYGAYIGFDRTNSVWNLMSYADPDFRETWKAFKGLAEYSEKLELSRDRLDQFIIGAVRNDLNPLKPDQATHRAVERFLRKETPEFRLNQYRSILAATPEKVKKVLAGHLAQNSGTASACVAASRENLDKIRQVMDKLDILDVLGEGKTG